MDTSIHGYYIVIGQFCISRSMVAENKKARSTAAYSGLRGLGCHLYQLGYFHIRSNYLQFT